MTAMTPTPIDTLSDGDAVAMLFDLAGREECAGEQMRDLDELVHARLMRTYGDEASPSAYLRVA